MRDYLGLEYRERGENGRKRGTFFVRNGGGERLLMPQNLWLRLEEKTVRQVRKKRGIEKEKRISKSD